MDSDLTLKKTIILEGNKDKFRNIYHDEEIVATVMGMLEYSLEIPTENVEVLGKAYTYMDEKKYMIEA